MKFHHTVITKLIDICTNYGGYAQESRLREQLNLVDLVVYEQKAEGSDRVLVMSDDLQREINTALNITPE